MIIDKHYHGYLMLPRQSMWLLQTLGHGLFGFYLELVMIANWDRRNKNFGRIPETQAELARILSMEQSTISRNFAALQIRNKYCVIKHKEYLILGFFPLFIRDVVAQIHNKDYANLDELYADMHRINAELHQNYANLQDKRAQNDTQSVYGSYKQSSFKPSSSASSEDDIDVNEVDEGIEKMKREGNKI